jgi:DNA gyrase subunit A
MLISTGGTVIRIPVEEFKRLGRSTQGVIVMRLRGDERVSALAPVVESSAEGENGENGDALETVEAGDDAGRAETPMADPDEPTVA